MNSNLWHEAQETNAENLKGKGHLTFRPWNYLTPGWSGEGLCSRAALISKKATSFLWQDADEQLRARHDLNPSMKQAIFGQFLSYAHENDINCSKLDSEATFWAHLKNKKSPYKKEIDDFIKIFCFRSVAVYVYKLRFMVTLLNSIKRPLSETAIMAPNYVLNKIFQKGGAFEINSEALQSNHFSWYHPSQNAKEQVGELSQIIAQLSISEVMKVCTYRPSTKLLDGKQMFAESDFSHSLSHKTFGLFLNYLIKDFPRWALNSEEEERTSPHKSSFKVSSCKFVGDYLSSFSQAHWLAEEELRGKIQDNFLCPEFIGLDFTEGHFTKICHELQFLTTLVGNASMYNKNPIEFICQIFKAKVDQANESDSGQISLFPQTRNGHYSCAVLNVFNLPKNNPHHFLLNQILAQANSLIDNAPLYLFSNQQLFVPSKSDKVERLLKLYKTEAIFYFDQLKGRGEISSYLYVLRKRAQNEAGQDFAQLPSTPVLRESCYSFRFTGHLGTFNKFNILSKEFKNFLDKRSCSTPFYQTELDQEFFFEFHQDAVVDGKLLHSVSNDPSKITHPTFFKNLTKNCIPFDQYFSIDAFHSPLSSKSFKAMALGQRRPQELEQTYAAVLIVHLGDPREIKLELVSASAYEAKREQLGNAYYQYFGLMPKIPGVNLNLFREYFQSQIGKQVVQLTLNEGPAKIKSKLKQLLIPQFFSQLLPLCPRHAEDLNFLLTANETLLKSHPQEINSQWSMAKAMVAQVKKLSPQEVLGKLSYFKIQTQLGLDHLQEKGATKVNNFFNPLILGPLLKLRSKPIIPKHPDIYVSILATDNQSLNAPLTQVLKKSNELSHYLELGDGQQGLIQLFGDEDLLNFVKFLLSYKLNQPIKSLIKGLCVPSAQDLKSVLTSFNSLETALIKLEQDIQEQIEQLISSQVSSNS